MAGEATSERSARREGLRSPYRSDASERLECPERDHFGHRDYAKALVEALAVVPRQFTIGLFGDWGSGKSTILDEVGRRLNSGGRKRDSALVIFDAWRYEGDGLRREFLRSIGEKLIAAEAVSEDYDNEAHTRRFDVAVTRPRSESDRPIWRRLGHPAIAVVFALMIIATGYGAAALFDVSKETLLGAEIAILGSLTAYVLAALNRALERESVHETEERLTYPDQFAENFRLLLGKVTVKRLVIGIDNLDRCSPERVARILSTVKTFLEPAIAKEENRVESLCFVIAADDEALRRHLTAQEMALSIAEAEADTERRKELARTAQTAVDEYLRKFFNATIRISDVLGEDMKAFSDHELEDFVKWHPEIDAHAAAELVEMTGQGLKRNPRRMKQFINNLELRLQLLSERRESERIQIEPDILVVAKLAVIEEEFPASFALLRERPQLLAEWQEAVVGDGRVSEMDERLVAFLRFSAHVQARDYRPYLSLKQTSDELDLPGYGELVGLLEDGDSEGLERMLDDESQLERAEYVEAAKRYFDQQLRERSWSRAHNTLRAMIGVESLLGTEAELLEGLVETALAHPDLRSRLPQLDPEALLGAAGDPGGRRFDRVLETLLSGTIVDGPEAPGREALFLAIAETAGPISRAAEDQIRETLGNELVKTDFSSYLDLALARPELIGEKSIGAALGALESGVAPFAEDSAPLRIVQTLVDAREDPELGKRLVAAARPQVEKLRTSDPETLRDLFRMLSAPVLANKDAEQAGALGQLLTSDWESGSDAGRLIELDAGVRLCRAFDGFDASFGGSLGFHVMDLEDIEQASTWVRKNSPLPPFVREGLIDLVATAIASGESPQTNNAQQVASALPKEDQERVFGVAALRSLESGNLRAMRRFLKEAGPTQRSEIVAHAASMIGEGPGGAKAMQDLHRFVVEESSHLPAEGREALARSLVSHVASNPKNAQATTSLEAIEVNDPQVGAELATSLLDAAEMRSGPAQRRRLLTAAFKLGASNTRVRERVEAGLKAMRESNDPAEHRAAEQLARQIDGK